MRSSGVRLLRIQIEFRIDRSFAVTPGRRIGLPDDKCGDKRDRCKLPEEVPNYLIDGERSPMAGRGTQHLAATVAKENSDGTGITDSLELVALRLQRVVYRVLVDDIGCRKGAMPATACAALCGIVCDVDTNVRSDRVEPVNLLRLCFYSSQETMKLSMEDLLVEFTTCRQFQADSFA